MQDIKDRFTLKNIIFVILILLVIKFIFAVKNLALLVFASFVIAASLNPFVDKLQKWMSRGLATTVALTTFLSVILGAVVPLILIMLEEINTLIVSTTSFVQYLTVSAFSSSVSCRCIVKSTSLSWILWP